MLLTGSYSNQHPALWGRQVRKLALRTSFIARTRKCTSKRAVSKAKANSNTSADLIQLGRRRRARRPNWLCGVACLNAALAESLFQRASRAPCSKLWLHFQPADYSRLAVGSLDGASKKLATAGCCRRCRCRCCCVLTHSEQERERASTKPICRFLGYNLGALHSNAGARAAACSPASS